MRARGARRSTSAPSALGRLEQPDLGRLAARLARPRRGRARRCCRRRRVRRAARAPGRLATAPMRSVACSRSSSPAAVQTRTARIRFSVSVPVLSVQMTVVEPSVSTALSRLTSAPRRASGGDADRERERDRRQQPLGDVRDDQPDREGRARRRAAGRRRASRSGGRRARRRPRRGRSARRRAAPARSSGLGSLLDALGRAPRCDRARSASRSRRRAPSRRRRRTSCR